MLPIPTTRSFDEAIGDVAKVGKCTRELALRSMLDALSSGRLQAWGYVRDLNRKLVPIRISSENWDMLRCDGVALRYNVIEILTYDLWHWLGVLDTKTAAAGAVASEPGPIATGAPGRPTSMYLILREAALRTEAPSTRIGFARQLEAWLREAHPAQPPATAKTIGNNQDFRKIHDRLAARQAPENPPDIKRTPSN